LFSKKEQTLASSAFDHLIGQRSTKISHSLARLAELTRVKEQNLQPVLDKLEKYVILRRQQQNKADWYQLYHDIFSESVDHWNRKFKIRQRMKRLACGTVGIFIAAGFINAGYALWVNHYGRYLQLSPKKSISDLVEVYQGDIDQRDFFNQREFLYETPFSRQEIEADRLFDQNMLDDADKVRSNLIKRLPIVNRFSFYMQDGLHHQGYTLKNKILEHDPSEKIVRLLKQLAWVRSKKVVDIIDSLLEKRDDTIVQQAGIQARLSKM
jgi:hypothetical protein